MSVIPAGCQKRRFLLQVPESDVAALFTRLRRTRWPDQIPDSRWEYGTDTETLRALVDYWAHDYDWYARQATINSFAQFTAQIDGLRIHFVHLTPTRWRAGNPRTVPLLLLHGWPGSFLQFLPLLPLLTNPERDGSSGCAFDIVAPSLPGYGFSQIPAVRGMNPSRIAGVMHTLMTSVLGYSRYGVRATDLGADIANRLALRFGDNVIGVHTGGTNPWLTNVPSDLTAEEEGFVQQARNWMQSEMAYAMEHASKPQTLAHALNDSPAGLASWILEKFWRWGDTQKTLAERFGRDALIDNVSIYWFTGTIGSSMRLYYETMRESSSQGQVKVPTAWLMSRQDMFATPRSWVERQQRVDRWSEIDTGGHFLEWEVPEVVAADLRAFFSELG